MKGRTIKSILFFMILMVTALTMPLIGAQSTAINPMSMSMLGAVEMPDFITKIVDSAYEWFLAIGFKDPNVVLIAIAVLLCLLVVAIIITVISLFVKASRYGSSSKINKMEMEQIKKEKRKADAINKKANRKLSHESRKNEKANKHVVEELPELEKEEIVLENTPIVDKVTEIISEPVVEPIAEIKESPTIDISEFDNYLGEFDIDNTDNLVTIDTAEIDYSSNIIKDEIDDFDIIVKPSEKASLAAKLSDDEFSVDDVTTDPIEPMDDILDEFLIAKALADETEKPNENGEMDSTLSITKEQSSIETADTNNTELLDLSSFKDAETEPVQNADLLDFSSFEDATEETKTPEIIVDDVPIYVEKEIIVEVAPPTIDFENVEETLITPDAVVKDIPTYAITPEIAKLIAKIEKESLKQKTSTETITDKIFGGKKIYIDRDSIILPKSFESMLKQADNGLKDIYDKLKNELLSYDGVHARMITGFEVFRKGCAQARFAIKGKTLYVYLRVDPSSVDATLVKIKDYSGKKALEETPTEIRVSGKKKINICFQIIAAMFSAQGIDKLPNYTPEKFTADYPYVEKGVIYSNNLLYKD